MTSERPAVLDILHNSFRFGRSNEFKLPFDFQTIYDGDFPENYDDFVDSEEEEYYTGLLSASILLLTLTVVWCCALPCSVFCKKSDTCVPACKITFFYFALFVSILGFFISLRGNNLLTDGFKEERVVLDIVIENTNEMDATITNVVDLIPILEAEITDVQTECEAFDDGTLDNLPVAEDLRFLEDARDLYLSELQDYLSETDEFTADEVDLTSTAYNQLTGWIITFEILLGIITFLALVFKDSEDNAMTQVVKCVNICGCIALFTLGLCFVFLAMSFVIIIAPVAIFGADVCTPDLTDNLLREIAKNSTNPEVDFCEVANFTNVLFLSDVDTAGSFVCHYTECRGNNIAFLQAGVSRDPISVDVLTEFREDINSTRANIDGVAGTEDCANALDQMEAVVVLIEDSAVASLELVDCETFAPLAEQAEDSGCNRIVAGLGVIYISWTLGTIGLMVAMFCYATLDFERKYNPSEYDIPEATVESDDGYNKREVNLQ